MPYILYHTTHGPLAHIDAPAHAATAGADEIVIPCEPGADVNDRERWASDAAVMQASGLPAPTEELLKEYMLGLFTDKIQQRLDAFARTKTYDNMLSLCTYATSTNEVFALEGQYGVQARDDTWDVANTVMRAVLAGERQIPTWEDLEAELPPLAWPATPTEESPEEEQ